MPKFSQQSFSKLSTCHHDLQVIFFEVIKSVDCTILQGYRNCEDQEADFKSGRSKLEYPHSKHNSQPSMAVDVSLYPVNFSDKARAVWFGGYVMGIAQKLKDDGKIEHSIRWGGSWDGIAIFDTGSQLCDFDHFELIT